MWTTRGPTDGEDQLDDVTVVVDQQLDWDAASNLVRVSDHRDPAQWNPGYLPQSVSIRHDALYRVIHADYEYTQEDGSRTPYDQGTDWRLDHLGTQGVDPMREEPAPMATVPLTGASDRVMTQTWSWDYLANQTETTDDNAAFYERSLGVIRNGDDDDASGSERPTALYFAQNINAAAATDQAGWLQADYGVSGNLVALTVHAQCHDAGTSDPCSVTDSDPIATQMASLAETYCECDSEQHYVYRWDELNRLAEARRYDRTNLGSWTLATRQRYRYDGANQRTIKQTLAQAGCSNSCERTALYVYPGDFERRGLLRGTSTYDASSALGTETQYVVAGARMVLRDADLASLEDAELYLRDARMVASVGDLIGTTSAAFDVRTGRLVEASTYYPNGARETMVATPVAASEPMGFTGKEADEEVGVVYFGERYLVPRLGRWASPDPLHVHQVGGGEALNSYHYVGGNLLSVRDPFGLEPRDFAAGTAQSVGESSPTPIDVAVPLGRSLASRGSAALQGAAGIVSGLLRADARRALRGAARLATAVDPVQCAVSAAAEPAMRAREAYRSGDTRSGDRHSGQFFGALLVHGVGFGTAALTAPSAGPARNPHGFSPAQWARFANAINRLVRVAGLPQGRLVVQGSRVEGRAPAGSDIDVLYIVDDAVFTRWATQQLETRGHIREVRRQVERGRLSSFGISRDFGRLMHATLRGALPEGMRVDFSMEGRTRSQGFGPYVDAPETSVAPGAGHTVQAPQEGSDSEQPDSTR